MELTMGKEQLVEVAVVTTSGTYPTSGYNNIPAHQKVRIDLEKADNELKITSIDGWVAQVGGRQIDIDKSYLDNGLSGQFFIDWGPRQGGGGAINE